MPNGARVAPRGCVVTKTAHWRALSRVRMSVHDDVVHRAQE